MSNVVGTPTAFAVACGGVLLWLVTGPMFHYSDTWQLVINTRDHDRHVPDRVHDPEHAEPRQPSAIHLKLDELIRAVERSAHGLVDLEDLPDDELARLEREFQRLRAASSRKTSAS